MSDRLYKEIKTETAPTGSFTAGKFAEYKGTLSANPSVGGNVSITWNGKTYTFEFSDQKLDSVWYKKFAAKPNMKKVYISDTKEETMKNLHAAIGNYDSIMHAGPDHAFSAAEEDGVLTLYSHVKLAQSFTVNGLTVSTNTSGAVPSSYSTDEMYTGISIPGGGNATVTVDLLMRKPSAESYNVGPPVNGLQVVSSVTVPADQILPIETFGCSDACTVYR